jgi:hypothetical protein
MVMQPYSTAETGDSHWIQTGSHVMIVGAAAKAMLSDYWQPVTRTRHRSKVGAVLGLRSITPSAPTSIGGASASSALRLVNPNRANGIASNLG